MICSLSDFNSSDENGVYKDSFWVCQCLLDKRVGLKSSFEKHARFEVEIAGEHDRRVS